MDAVEARIREFFGRYEDVFNRALHGDIGDMDEIADLYASEFIAASPAGVRAGRNDDGFRQAMGQAYARYLEIGTRAMHVRDVRLSPVDDHHCMAHVAWTAAYARDGQPDVAIDFDVHYFIRMQDGQPKVFGWVSGDEQALLREHGIM